MIKKYLKKLLKKISKSSLNVSYKSFFVKKNLWVGILLALIVITFFILKEFLAPKTVITNKTNIDISETVTSVNKLMILPEGEVPVVFEIADPIFLSGKEPFFVGAEKGDILLIYQRAGKAIIYSKKRNLIVNAGPLVGTK